MATAAAKKKTEPTEEEKVDALLDAVDTPIEKRQQRIVGLEGTVYQDFDKTYVQQKLSYFPKIEFVSYLGKATRKATSDGVSLEDILESTSQMGQTSAFVSVIASLAEYAPSIMKDIYCMALGVPRHERDIVSAIFDQPHDDETGRGGLSDEDGLAIINAFLAQNGQVMRDFYVKKMPEVLSKYGNLLNPATE